MKRAILILALVGALACNDNGGDSGNDGNGGSSLTREQAQTALSTTFRVFEGLTRSLEVNSSETETATVRAFSEDNEPIVYECNLGGTMTRTGTFMSGEIQFDNCVEGTDDDGDGIYEEIKFRNGSFSYSIEDSNENFIPERIYIAGNGTYKDDENADGTWDYEITHNNFESVEEGINGGDIWEVSETGGEIRRSNTTWNGTLVYTEGNYSAEMELSDFVIFDFSDDETGENESALNGTLSISDTGCISEPATLVFRTTENFRRSSYEKECDESGRLEINGGQIVMESYVSDPENGLRVIVDGEIVFDGPCTEFDLPDMCEVTE